MNKFLDFLKAFETEDNKPIIESIKTGFRACFEEEAVAEIETKTELPVFTDQTLKTQLYDVTSKYNGIYNDTGWGNITNLVRDIQAVIPNVAVIDSQYKGNFPHKSKEWTLVGAFQTPKGGFRRALWINIIASGAGSVEDPLDKYDITVVTNTLSPKILRDDKALEYLGSIGMFEAE